MQRAQIVQLPKVEAEDGSQPQYVLTSADGQEVIIDAGALEAGNQVISGQLVQGATVQVMEGGQEVTYAYTSAGGGDSDTIVTVEGASASVAGTSGAETIISDSTSQMEIVGSDGITYTTSIHKPKTKATEEVGVDESFQYYDNIRGKINAGVLGNLVEKYDAEDPRLSKNDRLHQWTMVAQDYCTITGQTKTRTTLMKKWTSAKYYREHEGRSVDEGGRVKGVARTILAEKPGANFSDKVLLNSAMQAKNLKQYDAMKLEAMRLERDAQRVFFENAQIEGEKLRKENDILDVQVETLRLELAIRKDEALKLGVAVEVDVTEHDAIEPEAAAQVETDETAAVEEGTEGIVESISEEESPKKRPKIIRK